MASIGEISPRDKRTQAQMDELLRAEGIRRDKNLDYSCGVFDEDGALIAAGSSFKNTLRCLAVSSAHRGEGLMNQVVSHLLEKQTERGNSHVFLYTKTKNDRIFFHLASTLRKFQQRLSRLSPDTKMYGRIQTRINHLYEKIKNHRKNNVETISAHIVKDYGPIVMEDLSVMQIRKRARSRFMTNGYNDASLGYLRRRIQDKASSAGREIILVDPKGTSQTCSMCGKTVKKGLSVRMHECPHCKTKMDRDVNAARNILFRSGLVPAPWVDRPPASRG